MAKREFLNDEEHCWAYLMRCKNGSLYAGWTNHLAHRVHAHRSGEGGAKFTRGFGGVKLAYAEECQDKASALRREAALKKLTKGEKEALCADWAERNRPRLSLAGEEDGAEIRALYGWYVLHSTATFRYAPHTDEEFSRWFAEARNTCPVLTARDSAGKLMGFALAHPWRGSWSAYQWDVETTIYCAPESRGMGVGEPLYKALLAELTVMGYWNAYAVLADPNPESEAFHTRLGFALEGRNPRTGYKFGGWLGISTWRYPLRKGRGEPAPVRKLSEAEVAEILAEYT